MAHRDYNQLARAVVCPTCWAHVGARCYGARLGTRIKGTHWKRRERAAEARKKEADRAVAQRKKADRLAASTKDPSQKERRR